MYCVYLLVSLGHRGSVRQVEPGVKESSRFTFCVQFFGAPESKQLSCFFERLFAHNISEFGWLAGEESFGMCNPKKKEKESRSPGHLPPYPSPNYPPPTPKTEWGSSSSALRSAEQLTLSMGLEKCTLAAMNGFLKAHHPCRPDLAQTRHAVTDFSSHAQPLWSEQASETISGL